MDEESETTNEAKERYYQLKDQTRRERNRQHARVSRERKQRQFELIQEENATLRTALADLERQVAVNFSEINYLRELYQRSERENIYLRGQLQSWGGAGIPTSLPPTSLPLPRSQPLTPPPAYAPPHPQRDATARN